MAEHALPIDESSLQRLDSNGDLAALVDRKFRVIGAMTLIYMTSYIGLTVLAGFSRQLMSERALGPVNVGFLLIAANYALSWILALTYVRVANSTFDPVAARIAAAIRSERRVP
jgi:uncharacterized membrane protein (DUF485 family)